MLHFWHWCKKLTQKNRHWIWKKKCFVHSLLKLHFILWAKLQQCNWYYLWQTGSCWTVCITPPTFRTQSTKTKEQALIEWSWILNYKTTRWQKMRKQNSFRNKTGRLKWQMKQYWNNTNPDNSRAPLQMTCRTRARALKTQIGPGQVALSNKIYVTLQ